MWGLEFFFTFARLSCLFVLFQMCCSAPVNLYVEFVQELRSSGCAIPPEELSDHLQICQNTASMHRSKEALCKEIFSNMKKVLCSQKEVPSPITLSTHVCQDMGTLQVGAEEVLLKRLVDGIVCQMMCDDDFEKACQVLLWSYQTQMLNKDDSPKTTNNELPSVVSETHAPSIHQNDSMKQSDTQQHPQNASLQTGDVADVIIENYRAKVNHQLNVSDKTKVESHADIDQKKDSPPDDGAFCDGNGVCSIDSKPQCDNGVCTIGTTVEEAEKLTPGRQVSTSAQTKSQIDNNMSSLKAGDDLREITAHEADGKEISFGADGKEETSIHVVGGKDSSVLEAAKEETGIHSVGEDKNAIQNVGEDKTSIHNVGEDKTAIQNVGEDKTPIHITDGKESSTQEKTSISKAGEEEESINAIGEEKTAISTTDGEKTSIQITGGKETSIDVAGVPLEGLNTLPHQVNPSSTPGEEKTSVHSVGGKVTSIVTDGGKETQPLTNEVKIVVAKTPESLNEKIIYEKKEMTLSAVKDTSITQVALEKMEEQGNPHHYDDMQTNDGDLEDEYSRPDYGAAFEPVAKIEVRPTEEKKFAVNPLESFPQEEDGHFFFYFLTIVVVFLAIYMVFHNKQKIIALIVEGRHERRRRSHGVGYKKLDTK